VAFSDADRELLFARLSAHAAAEHIDLSELERRVAAVSEADSREQAHAVLADLPALPGDVAAAGAESARPSWGAGHGDVDRARPGWRPTAERFRDPRSRRVMRVWEDAAGGRHYVADDDG
jgi:hypothetical protein